MMVLTLKILIYTLPLWIGFSCIRRALIDYVQQRVYCIRYRVYDRVRAGEFTMQDKNVADFVHYLHALLFAFDNWDLHPILKAFAKSDDTASVPTGFWSDPRLKEETQKAAKLTFAGFFAASGFFRLCLAIVPFWLLVGRVNKVRQQFLNLLVTFFSRCNVPEPA